MESKFIKLAREAKNENNVEDAKKYYDMAKVEDPENPEPKYYYSFFKLKDSMNKDVPNNYIEYLNVASNIVKKIKNSSLSDDEKIELLGNIVGDHTSITVSICDLIYRNSSGETKIFDTSTYNNSVRLTVPQLEAVGDQIIQEFGENDEAKKLAAKCWKAIFVRANWKQWYYYQSVSGNRQASAEKFESLIKKIQKVDSSFTAEKPKAVQCGNK